MPLSSGMEEVVSSQASFILSRSKGKQTETGASAVCKWEKVTSETIARETEDAQAAL